jgi:hypothetical protein
MIRILVVIPACFWRESTLRQFPGFPLRECGNDALGLWTLYSAALYLGRKGTGLSNAWGCRHRCFPTATEFTRLPDGFRGQREIAEVKKCSVDSHSEKVYTCRRYVFNNTLLFTIIRKFVRTGPEPGHSCLSPDAIIVFEETL